MTRQRIDASADKYLAAYLIKCIENLGFTSWMAHAPPMPASHVDFVLNDSDLASRSTLRNVYQHMCMRWGSCEHQCPWPDATIARNEETHMTLPTNEAFSGSWTCSSLSRSASRDFATCRQPEQWMYVKRHQDWHDYGRWRDAGICVPWQVKAVFAATKLVSVNNSVKDRTNRKNIWSQCKNILCSANEHQRMFERRCGVIKNDADTRLDCGERRRCVREGSFDNVIWIMHIFSVKSSTNFTLKQLLTEPSCSTLSNSAVTVRRLALSHTGLYSPSTDKCWVLVFCQMLFK